MFAPAEGSSNQTLTNGVEQCSPGQMLFAWQGDDRTPETYYLRLDVVDPGSNLPGANVSTTFANANADGILTLLSTTTLNNVQVPLFGTLQTVQRFLLRIDATPNDYCGSLLLNYNVVNGVNGAGAIRFTSSRLWKSSDLVFNVADQIWAFETTPSPPGSSPPSGFSVSNAPVINGGTITNANVPGNVVMLLGNVVFNGATWPARTVYMGPGATLSFGDNASPPMSTVVTSSRFLPCSDQAFGSIIVGPNTDLNMVVDPNSASSNSMLVYGANTGVTVQPGGSFSAAGLTIDGCFAGVSTTNAANLNLNNTQITYQGLRPNGTRYITDPDDGGFVGVDISGADQTFGQVHMLNNVTIQNQNLGVQMGGYGGRLGVPYRQARLSINGGTITNVDNGVSNRFNRNGFLTTNGLAINTTGTGIETVNSFGSTIVLTGGTINAGQKGVELSSSSNTFMGVQGIAVTATSQFGIRAFQSPNSSIFINGNNITMPPTASRLAVAASVNGNINGQTSINANTITTLADDARGVSAVGNQNGQFGFLQGVSINNNQVLMDGATSTGFNVEDNGRGIISCNEVSSLNIGNGVPISGAFGMVVNSSSNLDFNCNYLGEVQTGLAIIGQNINADYERFAFHGNTFGLTVGLNTGLSTQTFDDIGGNPEYPAFEYRGNIPEDTKHFANVSMYTANTILARANDPLFTPTTGDFANWFDLVQNNATASNCGNCAGFTLPWPVAGECPPVSEVSESAWTQLYKTRMSEKKSASYPDDCVVPTTCYTPLAQVEAEFENILANTSFDSEAADALESLSELYAEGGYTEEELEHIVSVAHSLNSDKDVDQTFTSDLTTIRNALSDIPTCSEEGVLWKQSLDLSVKSYLPDGLTESEVEILTSTAEECSVT